MNSDLLGGISTVKALNYMSLLSILALIVAASGCSSYTSNNTSNNTQIPATATPETSATTVEIPTPVLTPASLEETPDTTNTTSISLETGTYTENGTHTGSTERNSEIEQSDAGITSTVSNGTWTVKVSEKASDKLKIIPANDSNVNVTGN